MCLFQGKSKNETNFNNCNETDITSFIGSYKVHVFFSNFMKLCVF